MKTFYYYWLLSIMLSLLMIAGACATSHITSQEKKEIKQFKKAQKLFLESSRYLKKITSGTAIVGPMSEDKRNAYTEAKKYGKKLTSGDFIVGSMSEDERNAYIKMLVDTLTEAKSVSDDVLAKIHPKLPTAYNSIFIPCLENQLRGFRDFDPEASIKGTILHNEWIDWWNAHYKEFAKI